MENQFWGVQLEMKLLGLAPTCADPSSPFRYLCEALSALNQRCPELAPRAPVRYSYVGGVDAATCRGVRNELHGLLRPNLAGKEWRTPVPEVSGISSVGSGEALRRTKGGTANVRGVRN